MEEIIEKSATTENYDQLIKSTNIANDEQIELLKETYLAPIIKQEKFTKIDITYRSRSNYIEAIFTDPINRHYIVVEINRKDTPEQVVENFNRGYTASTETFATEVYEMKWENH
ncbi:hypothetical protein [Companilactobacillus furfuricola]|uniref:hypothetical protein n=1 Tax=Companilactobacillus furfuricola TaxID=1462575 RepID=UPI000F7A24BD|nr:hypothetical protein [Companilactobacillus furfuricola]